MAEEATPTCPTLVQLLVKNAQNPVAAFALGVAAATGGPEVVALARTLLGL